MTAKIFSKDLRLAAHPMMYVFALFGVMLIIPNYPYTVVFFYGLLGIFFTFLNGRENKDVYYCAVLPVTKRDQVRARAWLVVAVELAELVIAIPFAFLSARINHNGTDVRDAQLHLARVQLVGQVPDGVFRIRHGGCVFQLFAARLGDAACAADVFQKALDSDTHFTASFAAIASSTALAAALPLVICGPCPSPATACAPANSSPSMK